MGRPCLPGQEWELLLCRKRWLIRLGVLRFPARYPVLLEGNERLWRGVVWWGSL